MATNNTGPNLRILQNVSHHFYSILPRSGISGPASLPVALNGIDGVVKRLDLTTSGGGYLMAGRWHSYDKFQFVQQAGDNPIVALPLLESAVAAYREDVTRHPDVATCLKEERLPLAKSDTFQSRLFCIFPFPFLVYARTFSVPLLDYSSRNAYAVGCLVGISPAGRDYDRLARHLLVFRNTRLWCPDYSAFEYNIPKNVSYETHRLLSRLFPPCFQAEYMAFAERVINVRVIGDRYVVYRTAGTTSGNPLTLLYNSVANKLLVRCAIFVALRTKKIQDALHDNELCGYIDDHIRDVYFGDDHLLALDYDALPIEPTEVALVLKEWSMAYTSNDKNSPLVSYDRLSDCTFLKRKFWLNSTQTWVGLLEPNVIFETLQWYHTQKHIPAIESVDAVYLSMMEEISLYGEPAGLLYKAYTDHIYSRYMRAPTPHFDLQARAIELELHSETSPDFFFQTFKSYHSNLVAEERTPLYEYLEQVLPGSVFARII